MAVTIFGMITVVIVAVFGTALRTQERAERELALLQRGRIVMETMGRDITNLYFRDETSYNVAISRVLQDMERERLRAEEEGNWDNFTSLYGDPFSDPNQRKRDNENPTIGDPFKRGKLIDLQFRGDNAGETDTISFAVHEALKLGGVYLPWGLMRVRYTVDKDILIRSVDTVESGNMDLMGNLLAKQSSSQVSKLAEGVKEFNIFYGFWFDNRWYEVESWASQNRQTRNSNFLLAEYDRERFGERNRDDINQILPGDEAYNERLNYEENELLDRLPAYIRLRMVLADTKNEERTRTFHRVFRVQPAEETYVPNPELNEDERDMEREERDERYTVVFPGVLEPE